MLFLKVSVFLLLISCFSKGVVDVVVLSVLKGILKFLAIILSNGFIFLLFAVGFKCIT